MGMAVQLCFSFRAVSWLSPGRCVDLLALLAIHLRSWSGPKQLRTHNNAAAGSPLSNQERPWHEGPVFGRVQANNQSGQSHSPVGDGRFLASEIIIESYL